MKQHEPVFFDAKRVRWRRTSLILEVAGALLTLLLAYFFITVAIPVYLPSVLQPGTHSSYRAVNARKGKSAPPREGRKRRVAALGKVPDTYDPLRAAFFVSWDFTSLASLKKHYKDLDLLIPEQLHAVTPDGSLTVVDYERYQTLQVGPDAANTILQGDKLHQWMRQQKAADPKFDLPIMGLVNNYDGQNWRIKELAALLADANARRRLTDQLAEYAARARQAGLVLDFEQVPDRSQPRFRDFVAELGSALHAVGLKLMVALPARDEIYDYGFIAKQCDAIILMNYDQHWQTSPPGSIAAQEWFMENLRQVKRVVPPSKIVMGIANYAYDWPVRKGREKQESATSLSIQEALLRANESDAQMEFDEDSLNPHYSYYDEQNYVHQVWMLDAVTAYNQLRASER
ncbi:MAG TPA: glycosyl hydrolase family 18 protein, partial [Methylomirabilota bacterium]|nr:glycosyl hydrolase family 18 protein [Methylomirabilota bacterium]